MNPKHQKILEDDALNAFNVRDEFKKLSLEEINDIQPKLGFSVCLLNLTGSLNVGNIIRSSVAFGANKVFLAGKKRYDKRSVVGANNYIEIISLPFMIDENNIDVEKCLEEIEKYDYTPVLCETGGIDVSEYQWPVNPCIVMGTEGTGIPEDIIKASKNDILGIDMPGVLRSINVSSAAAIVLYSISQKLCK